MAEVELRVDVWLWAARFFKTRRLSHEAIVGGKVEVNGSGCKPARTVKPGDHLRVLRGNERLEVEVLQISAKRGAASVAQELYRETAESRAVREREREAARLQGARGPERRPGKSDRRLLRRLKHGG
jgi:ribosome-associated heat shock protein Hsp15